MEVHLTKVDHSQVQSVDKELIVLGIELLGVLIEFMSSRSEDFPIEPELSWEKAALKLFTVNGEKFWELETPLLKTLEGESWGQINVHGGGSDSRGWSFWARVILGGVYWSAHIKGINKPQDLKNCFITELRRYLSLPSYHFMKEKYIQKTIG